MYKLNDTEFNFMLQFLPAYGTLNTKDQETFAKIISRKATVGVKQIKCFYFPLNSNGHAAVACIKAIRGLMGWGLKEAKDAYDAEHLFSLTDVKMTQEQVLSHVQASSTQQPVITFLTKEEYENNHSKA